MSGMRVTGTSVRGDRTTAKTYTCERCGITRPKQRGGDRPTGRTCRDCTGYGPLNTQRRGRGD